MNLDGIRGKTLDFYRSILALSNSSIVVTDALAPNNPIIFVNAAFEQLTGYGRAEAIGQNCRFLQREDDDPTARRVIAGIIERGEPGECLMRNYRKNGDLFWNNLYLFPLKDEQGRITNYVGIQHDVTVERLLVQRLEEKRRLIDMSSDVYLKLTGRGTIVDANAACAHVFGWTPEELLGNTTACLAPEAGGEPWGNLGQLMADNAPKQFNGVHRHKDGHPVLIEWATIPSIEGNALLVAGRDITERSKSAREAAKANALIHSIFDSITEGCFSIDRHWICTYINKKGSQWLQVAPADIVGKNIWDVFPSAVGDEFHATFDTAMHQQLYGQCEGFYLGKWLEARVYPADDGLTIFFLDISERKVNEEALINAATRDALTGMLNRASCIGALTTLLSTGHSKDHPLAVLFIDLDYFKDVNDSYGHQVGDQVLRDIGAKLLGFANATCIPARISGDEFVFILPSTGRAAALALAEAVREAIAVPIVIGGNKVAVGASIGIAIAGADNPTADELINQADTAMYVAKARGRHNVAFFAADINLRSSKRHLLREQMLAALHAHQFVLYYQPQVGVIDHAIVGAEALIRWQHPEFGLLSPATFMDLAEESPLILELGAWVMDEACRQLALWQAEGFQLKISVNVSARQLTDSHLPDMMVQTAARHGIAPDAIMLEVTESMLAQDFDLASGILNSLRLHGFTIALDDFGTGYSNLAYINRLPVTAIKIDRSFVTHIDTDKASLSLVNAIVCLAKSLDLTIICEGIETAAQRAALETTQCDAIQGYLISAPVAAEDFAASFLRPRRTWTARSNLLAGLTRQIQSGPTPGRRRQASTD